MAIVVRKSQIDAIMAERSRGGAAASPPHAQEREEADPAMRARFAKIAINRPTKRGEIFRLEDVGSRYEVLEVLGEGGTGRVVRAFDNILEMEVAIKILSPRLVLDPAALSALKAEVRVNLALVHRHILRIYNLERSGRSYMIIMELLKGQTLSKLLAGAPAGLDWDFGVQLIQVAADAIGHAHRHGVLHLDLTPANIFITDDGIVKIIDFGIARVMQAGATAASRSEYVYGTPAYMSPEQARGDALDARSDIYSLGVVAAQLLTGRVVGGAATVEQVAQFPHPPVMGLDAPVAAVIEKATAFRPDDRYGSILDFSAALASAVMPQAPAGRQPDAEGGWRQ